MDPADTTNDLLKSLVELTTKNAETLNRMLAVARFGPTAGAGGGASQPSKKPLSPEELAQKLFDARQTAIRDRGSALQQIGLVSAGSAYHRASSMAEGARGLGMSRLAGGIQGMAGPMAVASGAGAVMQTVGNVARVFHDRWSSTNQKVRELVRMVPGGETVQRFHDDVTGRSQKIEDVDTAHRKARVTIDRTMGFHAWAQSWSQTQAGRGAEATAFARQSMSGAAGASFRPVMDRSSARGEVAFQNEMKLLSHRKELLLTERDLTKASKERAHAEGEAVKFGDSLKKLSAERARVEKEINAAAQGGDTVQYRTALRKHENVSAALEQTSGLARSAEERAALAREQEARARGEHSKAKSRLELIGQAEVKQGATDRSMGTARSLGDMDPLQRQQGMNVLKMLQGGANPDLLPPDMKALARAVAPAEYDKIITRHGAGTETFKAGQQAGLVGFEGDPFKLQQEADELFRKGEQAEFEAEGQASKEVAESGERLGKVIVAQIKLLIEAAHKEIENQLRLSRPA